MAVECANCHSTNPDGQKFCGQCGTPLVLSLREQIQVFLKEQTKEQKLLEIETAQSVVTRLSDWGKLFGLVVGIPLALLAVVLTILGIKTYGDFTNSVEAAKKEALRQMQAEATAKVQEVAKEGQALSADIKAIRTEVESNRGDLKNLTKRVQGIEEKVEFKSKVSPDLQEKLQRALTAYQRYFKKLGYRPTTDHVTVDVSKDAIPGAISYYVPETNTLVIAEAYGNDPDIMLREYSHHVLYSKPTIEAVSNPERTWAYMAIESGLANYFVCSSKDNPAFGETTSQRLQLPGKNWSLQNNRRFAELKPGWRYVMSDGAQIWGGAFWDLRQKLGQDVADRLLYRTWFALEATDVGSNDPKRFLNVLLKTDSLDAGTNHSNEIKAVFKERGLEL
jgi:tetrahydromethanopterin S-methyltransferase subunit G